jgi:hypothetical protein
MSSSAKLGKIQIKIVIDGNDAIVGQLWPWNEPVIHGIDFHEQGL